MNIIIFGGSGFIGSHIADVFTENNHQVTIFDITKSIYLQDNQKLIIGNITDESLVYNSIRNQDVIINLAGIADIDDCKNDPVNAVKINIVGNIVLLEAARKHNIKRFIYASSAYIFSNHGAIYKNTKQSCELFIETYQKLYDLDYTIVRYGSIYGTRADETNTIHRTIKTALLDKEIVYRGTGDEVREYINVKDAAELTLKLLDEEFKNRHVLLTGLDSIKTSELNNMINEMLENNIDIKYLNEGNESHYKTTQYNFKPIIGKKLINNHYKDLGLGLLEIMQEIYETNSRRII